MIFSYREIPLLWRRIFDGQTDLRVYALLRIGVGIMLLVHNVLLFPALGDFLGSDGFLPPWLLRNTTSYGLYSFFTFLEENDWSAVVALTALGVGTVTLLLGIRPGLSAAVVLLVLNALQHRMPFILHGGDIVLRLLVFYLIWMPSGERWAVRLHPRPTPVPARGEVWPLRLMQIQMCAIYLSAAISKTYGNWWVDGDAMSYIAQLREFFAVSRPGVGLIASTPILLKLITWATVGGEFAIPLLVWFKETRRVAIVAAVLLHLGVEYTMYVYFFSYTMLVGLCAFLEGADLDAMGRWFKRPGSP